MFNQSPPFTPEPYVSAHSRARLVKILLVAGAVVSTISMLVTALTLVFPPLAEEDAIETNMGGFAMALVGLGVGLLTIAIVIATVVVFCMWLYRCCKNLKAFGTPRNRINFSPGWTVGSFFVPFANLVIPYRAIKELWQNSQVGTSFMTSPPAWFPIWWTFWLLSNFASNIDFRLSFNEKVPREYAAIAGVAANSLTIVAAILAIVIVSEIDKRQEEASKSLGFVNPAGPPMPPPSFGSSPPSGWQ
jgi:hypothetical protein